MEAFERLLEEELFPGVILGRSHCPMNAPVQDNLHLPIGRRLQQDRIHIRFGFDARSFGLHGLSPADFTAVAANIRIQPPTGTGRARCQS